MKQTTVSQLRMANCWQKGCRILRSWLWVPSSYRGAVHGHYRWAHDTSGWILRHQWLVTHLLLQNNWIPVVFIGCISILKIRQLLTYLFLNYAKLLGSCTAVNMILDGTKFSIPELKKKQPKKKKPNPPYTT